MKRGKHERRFRASTVDAIKRRNVWGDRLWAVLVTIYLAVFAYAFVVSSGALH